MHQLSQCQCVPEILSSITGPWAIIYYQAAHETLYFGKDAAGMAKLMDAS